MFACCGNIPTSKAKAKSKEKTTASYHCSVKAGGKGFAAPHSAYVLREGKYQEYSGKETLEYKESGNMPQWAKESPREFWKAADECERANGCTFKELEIALPRELIPDQRRKLVQAFVKEHIGENHPYSFAIHTAKAKLARGEQPHAHIMFTERTLDGIDRGREQFFKKANSKEPERGGAKKDDTLSGKHRKQNVAKLRESWALHQNQALWKHGHDVSVDHRSLDDQREEALKLGDNSRADELDRLPQKHLGPKAAAIEARLQQSERGDMNRQVLKLNAASLAIQDLIDSLELDKLIYEIDSQKEPERGKEIADVVTQQQALDDKDKVQDKELTTQKGQAKTAALSSKLRGGGKGRAAQEAEKESQAALALARDMQRLNGKLKSGIEAETTIREKEAVKSPQSGAAELPHVSSAERPKEIKEQAAAPEPDVTLTYQQIKDKLIGQAEHMQKDADRQIAEIRQKRTDYQLVDSKLEKERQQAHKAGDFRRVADLQQKIDAMPVPGQQAVNVAGAEWERKDPAQEATKLRTEFKKFNGDRQGYERDEADHQKKWDNANWLDKKNPLSKLNTERADLERRKKEIEKRHELLSEKWQTYEKRLEDPKIQQPISNRADEIMAIDKQYVDKISALKLQRQQQQPQIDKGKEALEQIRGKIPEHKIMSKQFTLKAGQVKDLSHADSMKTLVDQAKQIQKDLTRSKSRGMER